MIEYELKLSSPQTHEVEVSLTFEGDGQAPSRLFMPAWVPGSYTLRDFSKHIVSISACAFDATSHQLNISKVDSHTYEVEAYKGKVTVKYVVYCWDRSVRGAHFDLTHGFFNGTCLFLCVQHKAHQPIRLYLHKPEQTYQQQPWTVGTTLPSKKIDSAGFGEYEAENYEALVDYPIEMGQFDLIEFQVNDRQHRIAITGWQQADHQRLQQDVQKICQAQAELFEELPFERYLFLLTTMEDGYGGLEHRDSTALMCYKKCLPHRNMTEVTKDYRMLLGLISHEYFHAWNVKKIKPLAFCQPDLTQAQHTTQLWAFEGITSYYDDYMLLRAQTITTEIYLDMIAELMTRVYQGKGRLKQTLKESSFDAWTKFYHPNENSPNSQVSYYAKGALAAMYFDLSIRLNTQGQKSLDDVMRILWQEHGRQDIGVADGVIEQYILEVGGESLKPVLDQALNTTQDLSFESLFKRFGVDLQWDYAGDIKDKKLQSVVDLGIRFTGPDKITVSHCLEDGPACLAGISAGDTLVAMDGCEVTANNLNLLLERKREGDTAMFHVFREERLLEFKVTFVKARQQQAKLTLQTELSDNTKALRQGWLGV